jgi:hypothetical protein
MPNFDFMPSDASSIPAPRPIPLPQPPVIQPQPLMCTPDAPHLHPPVLPSPPVIVTKEIPQSTRERRYSLKLADATIKYLACDIPDPPAMSFVNDLSQLDRMWDDHSPQWDSSSPLRISGHPIALVYWPRVFRYQGSTQWQGIKQRWFEWRVCLNCSSLLLA